MPQESRRAVIFTTPLEYPTVAGFLTPQNVAIHEGTVYETAQVSGNNLVWDVGLAQIEVDDITSAVVQARRAIAYFKPHVILLVGVAKGIRDVVPGDVVVSTKAYGYGPENPGGRINPSSEVWFGSYGIEQCARTEAQKTNWVERLPSSPFPAPWVYLAPIVFDQKVVAATQRQTSIQPHTLQFLQSNYPDALAVEMGNYGFFQVAREIQQPIAAMLIRGISELIHDDNKGIETKQISTEEAAQHASAFAFQLLATFIPDQLLADSQVDLEGSQETVGPISILRKPHRAQCFTEPASQLDLMLIPGGSFTMGSPPNELGRYDQESPQHEVTVSAFLLGRYPVTQAQWRAIATRTDLKVKHDLDPDPSEFKGDGRPVEQVSWNEAVEFCDRLSRLTHHTYRLASEAEWEYACRAGTQTPFHFGETITTDLANYRGTDRESDSDDYPGHYGNGPKGEYRAVTTPVNHFYPLANAFGLCDLHGNVLEWCLDHWHDSYKGAPTDGSAWLTEDKGSRRVLRGGSWDYYPRHCRSAYRDNNNPGNRYGNIGFRVLCEAGGL